MARVCPEPCGTEGGSGTVSPPQHGAGCRARCVTPLRRAAVPPAGAGCVGASAGGACRSRGAAGAAVAAERGGEGGPATPSHGAFAGGKNGNGSGKGARETSCHNDSGPALGWGRGRCSEPGKGTLARGQPGRGVTEGPLTSSPWLSPIVPSMGTLGPLVPWSLGCPHPGWALPRGAALCHGAEFGHPEPGFATLCLARAELCRAELGFAVLCRAGPGGWEAGPWHGATRVNILLERRLLARGHPQPLEHREIRGPEPAPGSPFLVPPQRRLPQRQRHQHRPVPVP